VKYTLDESQILDHIILTCELTQCRCNWFRLPLQGQVPDTDPLQDLQRSADAARAAGTRHVPAIDATPHGEQVPGPGDVWDIPSKMEVLTEKSWETMEKCWNLSVEVHSCKTYWTILLYGGFFREPCLINGWYLSQSQFWWWISELSWGVEPATSMFSAAFGSFHIPTMILFLFWRLKIIWILIQIISRTLPQVLAS